MDNVIKDKRVNRISYNEYKYGLLKTLLVFIVIFSVILYGNVSGFLYIVGAMLYYNSSISLIFSIFLLIFCVFLLYFLYYTSKRVAHAVINKIIILLFIFLVSYYILNIINIKYAVLYILLYMVSIIVFAKFFVEKISERKYLFNNEKYKLMVDYFNISKQIENILFFRFTSNITRKEYFLTILFIILVNVFIFLDLYLVSKLAYILEYNSFSNDFDELVKFMAKLYAPFVLYAFFMLLFNRLTNIFGSMKYHVFIFIIIFLIFYFTLIYKHNIGFINNYKLYINIVLFAFIVLFFGIIPPKKEYEGDEYYTNNVR